MTDRIAGAREETLADFAEGSPKPEKEPKTKLEPSRRLSSITVITIFILVIVIASLLVGLENRYDLIPSLAWFRDRADNISLVSRFCDGEGCEIIMVVHRGENSEIRTLEADSRAVGFLTDFTIESFSPVISPDGSKIAYFTRGSDNLLSVLVNAPGEDAVEAVSIDTLEDVDRSGFELCEYAEINWSTDGQRIAVFVCNNESKESYLLVTEIGGINQVLEPTKDNVGRVRSAVWVGPTQIAYTQSSNELDVVYLLDVGALPSEPVRIYGP